MKKIVKVQPIPQEVVEQMMPCTITPEKIKKDEEFPFDIVIEDDVLNNDDPALKTPVEIANAIYNAKTEDAPGYFNINHPEGVPEFLIDSDENVLEGIPLNKAYMIGINPARVATSNMISSIMHGGQLSVEEVNTVRALVNSNFRNVSTQMLRSMFDTICQTLTAVMYKAFDIPLDEAENNFGYCRVSYFISYDQIPNIDYLVNLASYRAMMNDKGEINAIVTENTIAPHVALITNVIEMNFLEKAGNFSNRRNDIENAAEKFFVLRNKFMVEYLPEINSFVYDTLKEIVKHAALHMAVLTRSDIKLPISDQEQNKVPWFINGYFAY